MLDVGKTTKMVSPISQLFSFTFPPQRGPFYHNPSTRGITTQIWFVLPGTQHQQGHLTCQEVPSDSIIDVIHCQRAN